MLFRSGHFLRKRKLKGLSIAIRMVVWALLFLLGLEVGGNKEILHALPSLGVEALLIAVFGVLGSVLLAWLLWRLINKKGGLS